MNTHFPAFGVENLRGGQAFDHPHGPVAMGARPDGGFTIRSYGSCGRHLGEELATARKPMAPPAIGQPAEVANAGEALRKNVLQEAAQELFTGKGHGVLAAVMGVILPLEGHVGVGDGFDAVI